MPQNSIPADVERYVEETRASSPDYDDAQVWAVAWSRYCKYKNPGSDHCKKPTSEYFPNRKSASEEQDGEDTPPVRQYGGPLMLRRDYGSKTASEHELKDLYLEVNPRIGSGILRGNGELREVAQVLTRFMLPKLLGVGSRAIPKPSGKYRGFDFHWSNAQAAWDVITATPNMDVDGATFVLWCPLDGSSLSPLKRPWSLKEMQYVAKYLGAHPGYAGSYEASNPRMTQRVAMRYAMRRG